VLSLVNTNGREESLFHFSISSGRVYFFCNLLTSSRLRSVDTLNTCTHATDSTCCSGIFLLSQIMAGEHCQRTALISVCMTFWPSCLCDLADCQRVDARCQCVGRWNDVPCGAVKLLLRGDDDHGTCMLVSNHVETPLYVWWPTYMFNKFNRPDFFERYTKTHTPFSFKICFNLSLTSEYGLCIYRTTNCLFLFAFSFVFGCTAFSFIGDSDVVPGHFIPLCTRLQLHAVLFRGKCRSLS